MGYGWGDDSYDVKLKEKSYRFSDLFYWWLSKTELYYRRVGTDIMFEFEIRVILLDEE